MIYPISNSKPKHTQVVVNTFPKEHFNQKFTPMHGNSVVFLKSGNDLYMQIQFFFRVLNPDTKEVFYEFRTNQSVLWGIDLNHPDFTPSAVATIKAAIPDFNWYIKNNESDLTRDKFYTQNITAESSDKFIRSAYMRYKLRMQ